MEIFHATSNQNPSLFFSKNENFATQQLITETSENTLQHGKKKTNTTTRINACKRGQE
jgi:hypothetical protein